MKMMLGLRFRSFSRRGFGRSAPGQSEMWQNAAANVSRMIRRRFTNRMWPLLILIVILIFILARGRLGRALIFFVSFVTFCEELLRRSTTYNSSRVSDLVSRELFGGTPLVQHEQ